MADRIVTFRLVGDVTQFNAAWTSASATMTKVAAQAQAVGRKMSTMGTRMTVGFTLPVVAALGGGVKAFSNFDKAMTESLAIMSGVTKQMEMEMRSLAKTLSTESTFAAKELAQAYFFLASAGFKAEQSLKVLPVVTRFAQAGAFDLSRATSLLAGSVAALGLKSADAAKTMENMSDISDLLVGANQLADATTEQFATALTRAGGVMRAFGVDAKQGIAVLAGYAEIQRKAEVGGEAFARVLRLLIPAAIKNSAEYEKLGIRVFDAGENIRNFADILGDMESAFATMTPKQRSASLEALGFKRRMQGAILPLIGMSDRIKEFEGRLDKMGGTTQKVQQNQLKAFANQMTIVRNRIVNAFAVIGETVAPAVLEFAKGIARMVEGFNKLSPGVRKFILNAVMIAAVLGPVLMLVGKLIMTFGTFVAILKVIGTGIALFTAKQMAATAATTVDTTAKAANTVAAKAQAAANGAVSAAQVAAANATTQNTVATTANTAAKKANATASAMSGKATAFAMAKSVGILAVLAAGAVAWGALAKSIWEARKAEKAKIESEKAWAAQQADINEKYGSLANLRQLNRERSERSAAAEKLLADTLKSEIPLLEKIEVLTELSGKKAEEIGATTVAKIAEELDRLQTQAEAVEKVATRPFEPSEEDIEAQKSFEKAREKALFDQLRTESKINFLIEKRKQIQDEIAKTQEGSAKFFRLREQALEAEVALRDLAQERTEEIKDRAGKQAEQAKTFAGAVEAGSVEDYRLRIRSGTRDEGLKVQKDQKKQLADLNKKVAKQLDVLQEGFAAQQDIELESRSIV